jgi:hypothetical protein
MYLSCAVTQAKYGNSKESAKCLWLKILNVNKQHSTRQQRVSKTFTVMKASVMEISVPECSFRCLEVGSSWRLPGVKIQTPGNHPEENIQHTEHGESLKSKILHLYGEETARHIRLFEKLRIKKTKLITSLTFLLRCSSHYSPSCL